MTIQRIYQFTAETGYNADINSVLGGPTVSTNSPFTGTRSYFSSSSFWSRVFGPITGVRMGFYQYESGSPGTNVSSPPFLCYFSDTNIWGRTSAASIWARYLYFNQTVALMRWSQTSPGDVETLYTAAAPPELANQNSMNHFGFCLDIANNHFAAYLNGEQFMDYTGDVRPYGFIGGLDVYSNTVQFVGAMGRATGLGGFWGNGRIDDYYVDVYTDETFSPPPAYRFRNMVPGGVGEDTQFSSVDATPNWQNVNTVPSDYFKYNYAFATGLMDNFQYAASPYDYPAHEPIIAVLPYVFAIRQGGPGTPSIRVHMFDGLNYEHGGDHTLELDDRATLLFTRFTQQVDTTAWNQSDLEAVEFGYESRGTYA